MYVQGMNKEGVVEFLNKVWGCKFYMEKLVNRGLSLTMPSLRCGHFFKRSVKNSELGDLVNR